MLPRLSDEIWFANQLKQHGAWIFDGDTNPDQRIARIRHCISRKNLRDTPCVSDSSVTFAQAFKRLYGCEL